MKCVSIQNISGNEVYCTIFLISLVKIMLCSKLHFQIFFELEHILYKIEKGPHSGWPSQTIRKLTRWVCGAYPSTLERGTARVNQIGEPE